MTNLCLRKAQSLKTLTSLILPKTSNVQRNYGSALYVPGNIASKTFAFITPNLDFNHRFVDTQKLQKELDLRGVKVNVNELKKSWEYFQYVNSNRHKLSNKLTEASDQIRTINRKENVTPEDQKEIEGLITQCQLIKNDLKVVREAAWEFEETLIPQLLKLPNEIDERTPVEKSIVLKTVGTQPNVPDNKKQSHIDIGKNLDLLEYINPIQCYLHKETAAFELEVIALAGRILNENGIIRITVPDFSRSFLVEGCGIDHESPGETFIIQNTNDVEEEFLINRLHLTGGASFPSLFAIHAKNCLKPREFPTKFFSTGRQYSPFPNTSVNYGLFSVCQASIAQALIHVQKKDSEEYKKEFQNLIEITSKIYDAIGCHYRVVMRSAHELNLTDSMRISFEMWSTYANQYIEVGHVSACGDYFSKRLMFYCDMTKKNTFPAAITGTLLSVPRVLGCLLEENPEKFTVPENTRGFIL